MRIVDLLSEELADLSKLVRSLVGQRRRMTVVPFEQVAKSEGGAADRLIAFGKEHLLRPRETDRLSPDPNLLACCAAIHHPSC